VKSEWYESQDQRTRNGGLSPSGVRAAEFASGGDSTGGIQCLNLQDENPRSGFNWLCLVMTLLAVLFCECGLSLG
jgi:hypothetical protein